MAWPRELLWLRSCKYTDFFSILIDSFCLNISYVKLYKARKNIAYLILLFIIV